MNIEIKISKKPVDYQKAIEELEQRTLQVHRKEKSELIWILEHKDIYTCGTSGKDSELLDKKKFPILKTNRGGKWTYHGSGQKIVYFVLDMNHRGKEIRKLVRTIEKWIILILNKHNIKAHADSKNIGIWIDKDNKEYKIAAIGLKVKKWIAYHGFALNLDVNKKNYNGIIPCGISDRGIINWLEIKKIPKSLDETIISSFKEIFTY